LDVIPDMIMAGSFKYIGGYHSISHGQYCNCSHMHLAYYCANLYFFMYLLKCLNLYDGTTINNLIKYLLVRFTNTIVICQFKNLLVVSAISTVIIFVLYMYFINTLL
jgi:hypothetical protein